MSRWIFITLLSLTAAGTTRAATDPYPDSTARYLKLWQKSRIGMFIHYNPSCLIKAGDGSWNRNTSNRARYDTLYKIFNPSGFSAAEWVTLAKDFGARYINHVTKHHDGFCMFDSKVTTYDIMSTPFGRDIAKELSDECRRQGVMYNTYYSIWDMYQPDWTPYDYVSQFGGPGYSLPAGQTPSMARYIMQYMKSQITELVTSYNPGVMWYDVGMEHDNYKCCWRDSVYDYTKRMRPGLIVNDRAQIKGDFSTPECRMGTFDTTRRWEMCATLQRGYWFYNSDNPTLAPAWQYVYELISILSGDGNIVINLAPGPDGKPVAAEAKMFREIGAWVHAHAAGLYGTRGGPYMPGLWGGATRNDSLNKIYLHIPYIPLDTVFVLPPLQRNIVSAKRLGAGDAISFVQNAQSVVLSMPLAGRDSLAETVELTLDGPGKTLVAQAVDGTGFSLGIHGGIITGSATCEASSLESSANFAKLLTGEGASLEFAFMTRREANPYIIVDLKKDTTITGFEIQNSFDLNQYDRYNKTRYVDQARTLAVWVSRDKTTWIKVWQADKPRLWWAHILTDNGSSVPGIVARYVKIGLQETNVLTLKSVRIYGKSNAVLPGTDSLVINDDDPGIVYSGRSWWVSTGRPYGNYKDDLHVADTNGDYFEYTFDGIGIDFISEKLDGVGQADVFIDGVLQTTIDGSSPVRQVQHVLFHKDVPAGTHTIKVVKKSGSWLCVDALRIIRASATPVIVAPHFPAVIEGAPAIVSARSAGRIVFTVRDVPAGRNRAAVALFAANGSRVGVIRSAAGGAGSLSWDLAARPLKPGIYVWAMSIEGNNSQLVKTGRLQVVR
jgi:alpha-L-fucosidase